MSKYTICQNITSHQQEQYEESFDINDQTRWTSLRNNAADYLTEAELKLIPEDASKNLEDWLLLYKKLASGLWDTRHETITYVDKTQWILSNHEDGADFVDAEYIHLVVEE